MLARSGDRPDENFMKPWAVFKQDTEKKPHQMVGSVYAIDAETALLEARTVFARRPKAVSMWVVAMDQVEQRTKAQLPELLLEEIVPRTGADGGEETWQVFWKVGQRRSMTFVDWVGEVEAISAETAIKSAIDTFKSNKDIWVWMVVPDAEIVRSDPDDIESWFNTALSKTYKQQSAYGFVGGSRPSRKRGKGDAA